MARMGMDVDVVERIGHALKRQGHEIRDLINQIQHAVDEAQHAWDGNDSRQFHDWWQSQHRPALTHAAEAVEGLGQAALNNASEQRNVSGH